MSMTDRPDAMAGILLATQGHMLEPAAARAQQRAHSALRNSTQLPQKPDGHLDHASRGVAFTRPGSGYNALGTRQNASAHPGQAGRNVPASLPHSDACLRIFQSTPHTSLMQRTARANLPCPPRLQPNRPR